MHDVRKMKEVAANFDFSDISGSALPVEFKGVGPVFTFITFHPTTCILKGVKINISENDSNTRDNVSLSTF